MYTFNVVVDWTYIWLDLDWIGKSDDLTLVTIDASKRFATGS